MKISSIEPLAVQMSSKKYVDLVTKFFNHCKTVNTFNKCAGGARVISATEGKLRVELDVTEELTNPFGTLHGGCTATLIDIGTTTALLATESGRPGVSVDLHVSYLSAAKLGETIVMDCEVVRQGKGTAFTKAEVFVKDTDKKVALGLHTKAFPRV